MLVESKWMNAKKTMILQTYTEILDFSAFQEGAIKNRRLFLSVEHTVDIVIDLRNCKLVPFSFLRSGHIAESTAPPNVGSGVIVTDGKGPTHNFCYTLVMLGRSLGSQMSKRTTFATTVEEAVTRLNHNKTTATNYRLL